MLDLTHQGPRTRSVDGHQVPEHNFALETIVDNEVRALQVYLGLGLGPVSDERRGILTMMSLGAELLEHTSVAGFKPLDWITVFPDADIMGPDERVLNSGLTLDRMARILKRKNMILSDPASSVKKPPKTKPEHIPTEDLKVRRTLHKEWGQMAAQTDAVLQPVKTPVQTKELKRCTRVCAWMRMARTMEKELLIQILKCRKLATRVLLLD